MKKYLAGILLCLPVLLASCVKDEEPNLDDTCYISSVTLGQVKRVVTSGGSNVYTSYTGSSFFMSIDQVNPHIENKEPLLYGSDLRAVLVNIQYEGSYLAYRPITEKNDAPWTAYSSTDSIDLRQPIELYLIANNSLSGRIYTMKVNVSKQDADALQWNKAETVEAISGTESFSEMRATVLDGTLLLLGRNATDIMVSKRSNLDAEGEWQLMATDLPDAADLKSLTSHGGKLYVNTTDGAVYVSSNAETWNKASDGKPGLKLAAVTDKAYYALVDGKLCSSADMTSWDKEEKLDQAADSLPTSIIGSLEFQQRNGNHRLVMVGHNDRTPKAVVWNKMWYGTMDEVSAEWMHIPHNRENRQLLPKMANTCLFAYDGKCMAIGGDMSIIYVSNDFGLTWRKDGGLSMPAELKGTEDPVACAVDDKNVIWIIAGNQVWRGWINRLAR